MAATQPTTELDARYSSPDATPMPWPDAVDQLRQAELFWVSTVRADGRPHVTPMIAVWFEDALCFSTGPGEQKAKNLTQNPRCAITTGCNGLGEGLDLVIEGDAVNVSDEASLRRLAEASVAKYGEEWRLTGHDDESRHDAGEVVVFRVAPVTGYGFRKGSTFGQTRWIF